MTAAKRVGRPPRSEAGAATKVITIRVRPEVYEDLRQAAEASGRSIGAQAETRLIQREMNEVGRMVGLAIQQAERRAGKSWEDDASVRRRCRAAADFALNVLLGSPVDFKALQSAIQFQMMLLEQFASGKPGLITQSLGQPNPQQLQEMLGAMQDWIEGQKNADDALEAALDQKA